MKKTFTLLAVFAIALCASCSKDQEIETEDKIVPGEEQTGEGVTQFTASIPETKTYLGEPEGDVGSRTWPNLWSEGDAVNINGVNSIGLTEETGAGTSDAIFNMETPVSASMYYAVYPAAAVTNYNGSTHVHTVTVSGSQSFVAGSYDPAAYLMAVKNSTPSLNFSPLMGLIQLTTTGPAEGTLYIKSISVESVGDEKLTGSFTTNADHTSISGGSGNLITISANTGSGVNATKPFGTVFTFAVPAQNYASGIRFRITATENQNGTGSEQTMVFSKQSAFNVTAGTLYPLTAPAFKASNITLDCTFKTSSSAGFEWSSANVSNNVKKVWRLAIYSDSGLNTLVVQHDIPADENKSSVWKNQGDSKPRFVVGGLSQGTNYWCKVTDVLNGISAVAPFTTDAFTVVRASSPSGSTLVAEDFSEFGWGPAWLYSYSGHTYGGWAPVKATASENSISLAAPSGVVSTGYYVANEYAANQLSTQMNFTTAPRFNAGWGFVADGGFTGFIQAGFLRMGGKNANRQLIVLPELSGITTDKYATVDVTVKVAHSSSDDVTNNENFAVFLERGLTLSNATTRIYTGATLNRRYPVSLTARGYNTQTLTFRVNGVKKTDHLMVGPYNKVTNYNRYFIYSINVEKVSESSTETFDITDSETLELFRSRVAAGESSLNGNVVNSFTVSSSVVSGWASIPGYTGTLYGNDKTITGLTKPFFDDLQGAVQNLTLNSTLNITANQTNIGMFANTMTTGASLSYCTAQGSVTFNAGTQGGDEHATGGMVGHADGGSISNCSNYADVTNNTTISANEYSLGGIIGHVWTALDGSFSISNTVNYADVENTGGNTASNICMGGIVGQIGASDNDSSSPSISITSVRNEGVVSNSGDVSASIYVAGIAGFTRYPTLSGCSNILPEDPATTDRVVNSGNATSSIFIGGLVGQSDRNTTYSNACYNTVDIKNTGTAGSIMYMGGIVGGTRYRNTLTSTSATYNYNDGTLTENSSSEKIYIGGIAGYANNKDTSLNYCRNESGGDIYIIGGTRYYTYVGGVLGVGTTTSSFSYSKNAGDINFENITVSNAVYVGGINGGFTSNGTQTITGCENTGAINCPQSGDNGGNMAASAKISVVTYIGGISSVAGNDGARTGKTFNNCINRGNITVYNQLWTRLGGCFGYGNVNPSGCENHGKIVYWLKDVKSHGQNGAVGGVIGYINIASVSNLTNTGGVQSTGSSPNCYTGGIVGQEGGNMNTMTNCNVGKSGINIVGAGSGSFGNSGAGLFVSTKTAKAWTFTGCKVITGTKCQGTTVTDANMADAVVGRNHASSITNPPTLVSSF